MMNATAHPAAPRLAGPARRPRTRQPSSRNAAQPLTSLDRVHRTRGVGGSSPVTLGHARARRRARRPGIGPLQRDPETRRPMPQHRVDRPRITTQERVGSHVGLGTGAKDIKALRAPAAICLEGNRPGPRGRKGLDRRHNASASPARRRRPRAHCWSRRRACGRDPRSTLGGAR